MSSNLFCIKLFMISILFSVNTLAVNPGELVSRGIKNLSKWIERRDTLKMAKFINPDFYEDLSSLPRFQRRQVLDFMASDDRLSLYDLYFHFQDQLDLVRILNDESIGSFDGDISRAVGHFIVIYSDKGRFRKWLESTWSEVDKDIFLNLWDLEQVRPVMAGFIRRDHLVGNPELLLKWQQEEMAFDRLTYFVFSSVTDHSVNPRYPLSLTEISSALREASTDSSRFVSESFERFWETSFGGTIIKAARDDTNFEERIKTITDLIEEGLQAPGWEPGVKLTQVLNRGLREVYQGGTRHSQFD